MPLRPSGLVGIAVLRQMGAPRGVTPVAKPAEVPVTVPGHTLQAIVNEVAARGSGVVMTMCKGGVGKTTIAARKPRASVFRTSGWRVSIRRQRPPVVPLKYSPPLGTVSHLLAFQNPKRFVAFLGSVSV